MRWSELEQKARAYGETQKGGQVREQDFYWQEQRRQLQREEKIRQAAEERAWEKAISVLEKLQTEEALAAIREDVWQEGNVAKDIYTKDGLVGRGLQLVSDPYPMVYLHSIQDGLKLELKREHMFLGVFFVSYEDDQLSRVVVRSHKNYSLAGQPTLLLNFDEVIKRYGLEEGLNRKLLEGYRMHPEPTSIFPDQEDAAGRLAFDLAHHVNFVVSHQSLPAQLRKHAEEIVAGFPPFLQVRRELGHTELRQWGHRQIGSPRWMSLLDRAYPVKI